MGEAVGAPIKLGAAFDEVERELVELGAAFKLPGFKLNPATARLQNVNARIAQLQAAAKRKPALNFALKPLSMAKSATTAMQAAMQAATAARVKSTEEFLRQPTHIIPVCIDGLATVTETGLITITAPHSGQPWRLLGIGVTAQTTGAVQALRLTSFKVAGVEHVVTSNAAFASGAPTSPGIDLSVFAYVNYALSSRPEYRYRPWALKDGALRSDAKIELKAYNPHTATQGANISLFVQSNPCGDDSIYSTDKGGFLPMNSDAYKSFAQGIRKLSLFRPR